MPSINAITDPDAKQLVGTLSEDNHSLTASGIDVGNTPEYLKNYDNLLNKPSINGIELRGDIDSDNLNVNFRESSQKQMITIQCLANEKISAIIQKYREKANDHDKTKKFIYNAKELDLNKTAKESNLINACVIHIIKTKDIRGA